MDAIPETVRERVPEATSEEAAALAEWYAALARALAAFPLTELSRVEPALRSTPGPT